MGRSLLTAFATVPDPRLPRGRRHPLPAVLALATAATTTAPPPKPSGGRFKPSKEGREC